VVAKPSDNVHACLFLLDSKHSQSLGPYSNIILINSEYKISYMDNSKYRACKYAYLEATIDGKTVVSDYKKTKEQIGSPGP